MNFKNSDFLMLLVAFLVGYFFQEIMNGKDIIEGNNKCTCTGGIVTSCPHDKLEHCGSCTDGSKPREDTTKRNNKNLNINDSEYYCPCPATNHATFGGVPITVDSVDIGNEQGH